MKLKALILTMILMFVPMSIYMLKIPAYTNIETKQEEKVDTNIVEETISQNEENKLHNDENVLINEKDDTNKNETINTENTTVKEEDKNQSSSQKTETENQTQSTKEPVKTPEKQEIKFTVKDVSETKYVTTSLNVRKGPDASFDKLGTLSVNQSVTITGKVNEYDWYRISYKEKEGYVSGKYLTDKKPEPFKTILIEDGNVPESTMKEYDRQWKMLPSNVRNFVLNHGWKMYVTSYQIQGRYYNGDVKGSIAGVTIFTDSKIYVSHRSGPQKRHTLLHEIGHAVDWDAGDLSSREEFIKIYQKEKYTIKDATAVGDGHTISNQREYFATVFTLYYWTPTALKNSAPQSYEYMKNVINNL